MLHYLYDVLDHFIMQITGGIRCDIVHFSVQLEIRHYAVMTCYAPSNSLVCQCDFGCLPCQEMRVVANFM